MRCQLTAARCPPPAACRPLLHLGVCLAVDLSLLHFSREKRHSGSQIYWHCDLLGAFHHVAMTQAMSEATPPFLSRTFRVINIHVYPAGRGPGLILGRGWLLGPAVIDSYLGKSKCGQVVPLLTLVP